MAVLHDNRWIQDNGMNMSYGGFTQEQKKTDP